MLFISCRHMVETWWKLRTGVESTWNLEMLRISHRPETYTTMFSKESQSNCLRCYIQMYISLKKQCFKMLCEYPWLITHYFFKLTSLELQYVSPKLLMCRDLELAVPGTYDPNQPVIRIQSIAPSLQVITSKLTLMGMWLIHFYLCSR